MKIYIVGRIDTVYEKNEILIETRTRAFVRVPGLRVFSRKAYAYMIMPELETSGDDLIAHQTLWRVYPSPQIRMARWVLVLVF